MRKEAKLLEDTA